MANDTNKIYEYLNEHGLQTVAKGILSQVNSRINERIVTTLDENSDDNHVASAATVYKAIINSKHTSIKFITGNIDEQVPLEERDPSVLYFQRDDEDDKTWMIYIWDVDNTSWVCVGDTEIDLSNYWSKDENEELKKALGIDVLEADVTTIKENVTTLQTDVEKLKSDSSNVNDEIIKINKRIDGVDVELDLKVNKSDLGSISIESIDVILDAAYEETDPFKYEEVKTLAAAKEAISAAVAAGKTEVGVRFVEDVAIAKADTINVPENMNVAICIDQDCTVTADVTAIKVASGATLSLNGRGTLKSKANSTDAVIDLDNATININGITIDSSSDGATAYGVYGSKDSTINFNSGCIKAGISAITTNNTTGGSTINIKGGELYSTTCYAIYNASQGDINITGGIVQGINTRMGNINISGNAQIIPTILNESNYDNIGEYFATTGVLWLGDTITIVAGTYSDTKGIDVGINISEDAIVTSDFRSAIGIYSVDTKTAANINVAVENGNNVTTTDAEFNAISVYDHDYISTEATAAKKTYNPVATSSIVINVDGSQIYPAV